MKMLRLWKMMLTVSTVLLYALVYATILVPSAALADLLGSGNGTIHRLTTESSYKGGCFPPCMCPIMIYQGLSGTFKLTYTGLIDGINVYSVDDIHWLLEQDDVHILIAGSGVYSIGSPDSTTVMQHRMELDLTIDNGHLEHFDSGLVLGGFDFPKMDIVVSVNGIECYDTVFHILTEPTDNRKCGGIAGIPCADPAEFCKLPQGDCCCDFFGFCTPIPTSCPDVWNPVCGCDGVTHGNECEADAAGTSIDYRGECDAICEADFTCDGDVDAEDVTLFLAHFGREPSYRACGSPTGGPCDGDFDCDVDVDADDLDKFLEDFGREPSFKPCPACVAGAWCVY